MTSISLPLPRIEIVGKEFRRLGTRWKGWGAQQISHSFIEDFFASTDMNDAIHTAMKNTFSGDHAWGNNVIRLRLQLWTMLDVNSPNENTLSINTTAMSNLVFFLDLARKNNMYVLLCGCENRRISTGYIPAWYLADSFGNADPKDRWDVQAFFFTEVAKTVVASNNSSTIIGYDLINEPIISASATAGWFGNNWLGGIDYLTTVIARGQTGATAQATAVTWMTQLRDAIKTQDPKALVTVGALPYGGAAQPFGVPNSELVLDFLSPHLYPFGPGFSDPSSSEQQALDRLNEWGTPATTPVLIGEVIPWSSETINDTFFARINQIITGGVISFSMGYGPDAFPPDNYFPKKFPASNVDSNVGGTAWFYSLYTKGQYIAMAGYRPSYLSAP